MSRKSYYKWCSKCERYVRVKRPQYSCRRKKSFDRKCRRIKMNNMVYVDSVFGSDVKGRLEQMSRPFRTISRAINEVSRVSTVASDFWNIVVKPGRYNEDVVLPGNINLNGLCNTSVTIKSIKILGSSLVKNVTIDGSNFPLLITELNNDTPEDNIVTVSNVIINASGVLNTDSKPVVLIGGSGLDAIVDIQNSEIEVDISENNPETSKQIVFSNNSNLALRDTDIRIFADFKAPISMFDVNAGLTIDSGSYKLFVKDGNRNRVVLFDVKSGPITVRNNISQINQLILSNPVMADVFYLNVENDSQVLIADSTAILDGVTLESLNLLNKNNPSSVVSILNLKTPGVEAPKIQGTSENLNYVIISGTSNIVTNGGYYGNIIQTMGNSTYFVKENDYTVLSNGNTVGLFDPTLANNVVLDKGKIVVIKNISDTNTIDVIFDNSKNYDPSPVQIPPYGALTLQNNGTNWFIIASHKP